MVIYCDIDGTLTDRPLGKWENPNMGRINQLKKLIEEGNEVVLWSAGGREYAEIFANQFGIKALACLGKPDVCVDDNPNIRPSRKMPIKSPEVFFGS